MNALETVAKPLYQDSGASAIDAKAACSMIYCKCGKIYCKEA